MCPRASTHISTELSPCVAREGKQKNEDKKQSELMREKGKQNVTKWVKESQNSEPSFLMAAGLEACRLRMAHLAQGCLLWVLKALMHFTVFPTAVLSSGTIQLTSSSLCLARKEALSSSGGSLTVSVFSSLVLMHSWRWRSMLIIRNMTHDDS